MLASLCTGLRKDSGSKAAYVMFKRKMSVTASFTMMAKPYGTRGRVNMHSGGSMPQLREEGELRVLFPLRKF